MAYMIIIKIKKDADYEDADPITLLCHFEVPMKNNKKTHQITLCRLCQGLSIFTLDVRKYSSRVRSLCSF